MNSNPREEIIKAIYKAVNTKSAKTYVEESQIKLDIPELPDHGDYSTNIALQAFQKLPTNIKGVYGHKHPSNISGKNPREFASNIVEILLKDKELNKIVDKIETASPGFINFFLKKDVLFDILVDISSYKLVDRYSRTLKNQKISVEFTDPNPFKEFHIGHVYSNSVGESISRLLESQGATVWRADYFGDAGLHVAKSIWGIQKKMSDDKLSLLDLEKMEVKSRINFMAMGYALGSKSYEEDEGVKKEIGDLNTKIYIAAQRMWKEKGRNPAINYNPNGKITDHEIDSIYSLYVNGRQWSLDYFETIYARLGTKFNGYYPESLVGEVGYKYVKDNVGKVFEESEGAVVFKGEKFGLHTRVFINKHNLPTYEAKELGLAPAKYEEFKYDKSIIVTGNEINEYFKVLITALKEINPKLGNSTFHIGHGMVRLPEGKMSSRTGKVVTGESIIDEMKSRVMEMMKKSSFKDNEKDAISEMVAIGAIKYSMLKNGIGGDIIFDFDTSLSLEGNSGPYLQYTYARTQSVARKAGMTNDKTQMIKEAKNLVFNEEELAILRVLVHFPEVVAEAAERYAPNLLCNYLYDLAQKYNSFYNANKIIGSDNEQLRLQINSAVGIILKEGLNLLGIQAPERM